MTEDEKWMQAALKEAQKAFDEGEVPVGAVIVSNGRIIARGCNQVEMLKDATAHAEMLSITVASAALENWRLSNTTLYSTLEPCSMCLGAMLLSRIPRLVFGAPDIRHGALGSWVDLLSKKHPTHQIEVVRGVLEAQCADLMRTFFEKQRKKNELGKDVN
jgi:tRNA(adenine34) deaminase